MALILCLPPFKISGSTPAAKVNMSNQLLTDVVTKIDAMQIRGRVKRGLVTFGA